MRPVTVKDCYVMAPLLEFYNINIMNLVLDTSTVRARVEQSLKDMEFLKSGRGRLCIGLGSMKRSARRLARRRTS